MPTHDPTDARPTSDAPELTTTEARAGATPHVTRYALGFGLVLVVIAFIALLAFYMRG